VCLACLLRRSCRLFRLLYRKTAHVPEPSDALQLMFWTRSGAAEQGFPAKVFSADDVLG
jgi:hypothetical protein